MPIVIGKNKFYSPVEVGELLGLHPVTVRNRMRSGELLAHKFGGRWYISEEKLAAALDGEYHRPNPAPNPPANDKQD